MKRFEDETSLPRLSDPATIIHAIGALPGDPEESVMSSPTREEMNARLEAAAIQEAADVARLEATDRELREQLVSMRQDVRVIDTKVHDLKVTIVVTGASATLAILLGVGAINATIIANMLDSFEMGASVRQVQKKFENQLAENTRDVAALKKVTDELKQETAELKQETAGLRSDMHQGFAEIQAELKAIRKHQSSK